MGQGTPTASSQPAAPGGKGTMTPGASSTVPVDSGVYSQPMQQLQTQQMGAPAPASPGGKGGGIGGIANDPAFLQYLQAYPGAGQTGQPQAAAAEAAAPPPMQALPPVQDVMNPPAPSWNGYTAMSGEAPPQWALDQIAANPAAPNIPPAMPPEMGASPPTQAQPQPGANPFDREHRQENKQRKDYAKVLGLRGYDRHNAGFSPDQSQWLQDYQTENGRVRGGDARDTALSAFQEQFPDFQLAQRRGDRQPRDRRGGHEPMPGEDVNSFMARFRQGR